MPFCYRDRLPLCSHAGVYSITNTLDGKVYIGSALVVRARLHAHRSELRRGIHANPYLQRAWTKYGEAAFKFAVLQSQKHAPETLLALEQTWMDKVGAYRRETGYNLGEVASAPMAGRKHTAEARTKMSAAQKRNATPEKMKKLSLIAAEVNRGKPMPESLKAKLKAVNKGKPKSEAHKAKIKANHWSKRADAAEIAAKSAEKNRGKRHGEDAKAKISESGKRAWAKYREEFYNRNAAAQPSPN